MTISARCTCGKVTLVSTMSPILQLNCHCADCRAATGDPFTRTAIFRAQTARKTGQARRQSFLTKTGTKTHRDACRHCGTVVFDISEGHPALIGVLARCLDPPFCFAPSCHLWVESKLPDVAIADAEPHFEKGLVPP